MGGATRGGVGEVTGFCQIQRSHKLLLFDCLIGKKQVPSGATLLFDIYK